MQEGKINFNKIDIAPTTVYDILYSSLEKLEFNEKKNAPFSGFWWECSPADSTYTQKIFFRMEFFNLLVSFNWENCNFLLLKEQSSSTHTIEFVGQRHCDNLSLQRSLFRTRSVSLDLNHLTEL